MSDPTELSLASLGDGGAVQIFDRELQSVLANIQDPNTSPKQARKVVLEVVITPDGARDLGKLSYKVSSKLAGVAPIESRVYLAQRPDAAGVYHASEHNPKQPNLEFQQTEV